MEGNGDYAYTLEMYRQDGTRLGQAPAHVDWAPASDACLFEAIRKGLHPPLLPSGGPRILPVWSETLGEPYLRGVRVTLARPDGQEAHTMTFPTDYFAGEARRASEGFVREGSLKPGDRFLYLMTAYPCAPLPRKPTRSAIRVKEKAVDLALTGGSLREMEARSSPSGPEPAGDMPVFVHQSVLDAAGARTREAGSHETGGILIGHLRRDTQSPELMAEVTAEVKAEHCTSDLLRITFTAETWTAARAAIEIRDRGERMLGWWHSHSFLKATCQKCPRLKDKSCEHTAVFMSEEDCALHRAVFHRAYSLALVVGDTPCKGLRHGLFGWRMGAIQERGYRVLPNTDKGEESCE